jgi:hypothetical protein
MDSIHGHDSAEFRQVASKRKYPFVHGPAKSQANQSSGSARRRSEMERKGYFRKLFLSGTWSSWHPEDIEGIPDER